MKIRLALILSSLLPTGALAEGVNLAWDNCAATGGAAMKSFACNTNVGTHQLFVSVVPPAGIVDWTGFETDLRFQSSAPLIPEWWKIRNPPNQTGACRNGALSISASFADVTGCTDLFANSGVGAFGGYFVDDPVPGGARLRLLFLIPTTDGVPLSPAVEYYAARIAINNSKTVGSNACAGCGTGMCIRVASVKVLQQNLIGADVPVTTSGPNNLAMFQSGSACVTAVRPGTWGAVKALYR